MVGFERNHSAVLCLRKLLPNGAFSVKLIVLAATVAGRMGPTATHLYAAEPRLAYRGVPAILCPRHDRNSHRLRVKAGASSRHPVPATAHRE